MKVGDWVFVSGEGDPGFYERGAMGVITQPEDQDGDILVWFKCGRFDAEPDPRWYVNSVDLSPATALHKFLYGIEDEKS